MGTQQFYRGKLTAKIRLRALWDDGDTRDDRQLAEAVGCALHTVQTYHREWKREHKEHKGYLPDRVVIEIVALRNDGFSYPTIVDIVAEEFGVVLKSDRIGQIYREGMGTSTIEVVEITEDDVPLMTVGGIVWEVPIGVSRCRSCLVKERCDKCDIDDFLPCEKVLRRELLPNMQRMEMNGKVSQDSDGISERPKEQIQDPT